MPLFQPWESVPPGLDPGTRSIEDEHFLLQHDHLKLVGIERLSLAGTGQLFLSAFGSQPVYAGNPKIPSVSFTVPDGWMLDVITRLDLRLTTRVTLLGSADLYVTDDFATRSRIVLAGRG
jgi:hypothetical protein